MDFESLIRMSVVNKCFRQFAIRIFKQRYKAINRIEIDLFHKQKWLIDAKTLHLDSELGENFLKGFGNSIKNLHIRANSTPSLLVIKRFGYLINTYCSESLIEFNVNLSGGDFFSVMDRPFKHATNVTILKTDFYEPTMNLELDELFPELRFLNLDFATQSVSNDLIIDRQFFNLIELSVNTEIAHDFVRIFQNNPQIRKLILRQVTSTDIFKIVNGLLSQLQTIEIVLDEPIELAGELSDIHFENVEELTICDHRIQPKFTFKQLKSFTLNVDKFDGKTHGIKAEWIDFMAKNTDLNKLIISKAYFIDEQLQLLTQLHQLIEVSIQCDADISVDTIIEFLENNEQMQRFIMKMKFGWHHINHENDFQLSILDALRHALDQKWIITLDADNHLFRFIRMQTELIDEDIDSAESTVDEPVECTEYTFIDFKLFDFIIFQQKLLRLKKSTKIINCLGLMGIFFQNKFAEKLFAIHNPIESNEPIETELPDIVHIYDYRLAWNVVKSFGHLITKLSVIFCDSEPEMTNHIVKYCLKSLKELHLGSWDGNWLNYFHEPFENVRKLSLQRTFIYDKFLDRFFPNIKELHLNYIETFNVSFIERSFPFLENLSVNISPYNGSNYLNVIDVGKLLKHNPQIRSIKINNARYLDDITVLIDHLNEIVDLNFFSIKHSFLSNKLFNQLTLACEKFTNLIEIALDCGPDVQSKNVATFIKNHKALNEVRLRAHTNIDLQHFRSHFEEDVGSNRHWKITELKSQKESENQLIFINMKIQYG